MDSMYDTVRAQAQALAVDIIKRARQKAPTHKIASCLSFVIWSVGDNEVSMDIVADLDIAPEARAYEYGSGIHAERNATSVNQLGAKGKIVIRPKNRKALAFAWDKAWPSLPRLPDGRVLLWSVNHPGVESKPYLKPAIDAARRAMLTQMKRELRNTIKSHIYRSFYSEEGGRQE